MTGLTADTLESVTGVGAMTVAAGWCAPAEAVAERPWTEEQVSTFVDALRTTVPAPEPVQFPAPRDPVTADWVEKTARRIQRQFPYRTLLDCREIAADIVDRILCWDAGWPEAEGDCGCESRGMPEGGHWADCIWSPGSVGIVR